METRLSAAVIEGCKESLRLEATSRTGALDAADEGSLPEKKKYKLFLKCVAFYLKKTPQILR